MITPNAMTVSRVIPASPIQRTTNGTRLSQNRKKRLARRTPPLTFRAASSMLWCCDQ